MKTQRIAAVRLIFTLALSLFSCTEAKTGIPLSTFDAPFPKRNIDFSSVLGREIRIKRGEDTLECTVLSTKTGNVIRRKLSGDTLFAGKICRFRGLYYFSQQVDDSSYWIYPVRVSDNLVYGMFSPWEQMVYIDQQAREGSCGTMLKYMDAERIRLHPDKHGLKKLFASFGGTSSPDTILPPVSQGRQVSRLSALAQPTTSIDPEEYEILSNVYPNPASSYVNIVLQKPGRYSYQVYDLSGRLSLQGSLTDQDSRLDFSSLPRGMYTLSVTGTTPGIRETIRLSKID